MSKPHEPALTIEEGMMIFFRYALTTPDGALLASSAGEPIQQALVGRGDLIPGLDEELPGHKVGDRIGLTLGPEDAFGEYEVDLRVSLPLSAWEGMPEPLVGEIVILEDHSFDPPYIRGLVVEISGGRVSIECNHILAGETICLSLDLLGARPATAEEAKERPFPPLAPLAPYF